MQEQLQSQQAPPRHQEKQQQEEQQIQQQRQQEQLHHQQQQQQARQENNFSNDAYAQAPVNHPAQRPQPQRQAVPPQQQHQHQYQYQQQQQYSPEQAPNEELKDNLTWQQREVAAQKNYRGGSAGGNYSYKNSQRYQRSFQGGNRINGAQNISQCDFNPFFQAKETDTIVSA
jgi:hypothetical protein